MIRTLRPRTRLLLALVLCTPALHAAAQTAPAALPAWDQLSGAQREQLIAPIRERWNSEPEQRARMLAHAQRWQELTQEQRRRAHHGMRRWEGMNPEQREEMRAVFAHIRPLPKTERQAFMEKWRAMTAEQKRAWMQAHPAPAGSPSRDR